MVENTRTRLKQHIPPGRVDQLAAALLAIPHQRPVRSTRILQPKMARSNFFKNYRVYMLTSVAYMGSLLFGTLYCGKARD